MKMMKAMPLQGGVAIQAEDEIASMGLCLGAAAAGCRAMTASSGPGVSLYTESIGLAIMMELPLVIVNVQRLGPATGGATTVGQGDIQMVRWVTSGGYPIIALAPSSVPECFSLTIKAFELACKFRTPVFLVSDKELNMTMTTVAADAWQEPAPSLIENVSVPPLRTFRGDDIVRLTGSTHDEDGFITKDPQKVEALNTRLRSKIEDHRQDLEMVVADVQPGAQTLLISFGITAGAMREAVQLIREQGRHVSALSIQSLWPVPEQAIRQALPGIKRVVIAELNNGQYRREIERVVSDRDVVGLNRIDGQLIAPQQFMELVV